MSTDDLISTHTANDEPVQFEASSDEPGSDEQGQFEASSAGTHDVPEVHDVRS